MNMFKKVKAKNTAEYLASLPDDQKELINFLHNLIQITVPNLKTHFANNMLGYGSFPYKNYKNEDISWPVIALANQKQYISIYVCALDGHVYLAEKYKKELGKVSVGRSCIRFKKLEDINIPILKKILIEAAKNPGLIYADSKKNIKNKTTTKILKICSRGHKFYKSSLHPTCPKCWPSKYKK